MDLVPLADRVLIEPDIPTNETASGLSVVRDYNIPTSGRVVSVGSCRHPLKAEAFDLAARLSSRAGLTDDGTGGIFEDAAQMLRDLTGKEPELAVGDRVVFSAYVGQELVINETRYLVLREADVLAVVESA